MTDKLNALITLRDKVKAGDVRDWRMYMTAFGLSPDDRNVYAQLAYNGSLDAARKLHNAVLPDWDWILGIGGATVVNPIEEEESHDAASQDNPARAWLLAILEALIAIERNQSLVMRPKEGE